MASAQFSRDVECPYFLRADGKRISCESLVDSSTSRIEFNVAGAFAKHYRLFCENEWKKCPMAQALGLKWEREEEKERQERIASKQQSKGRKV